MKTLVDNPMPPFRLYSKRESGEMIEQEVWVCGECKMLTVGAHTFEGARDCCRLKRCVCGEELKYYRLKCIKCEDAEFATKENADFNGLPVVEYQGEPVYHNDQYFECLDDFLEWLEDDDEREHPEYAQVCDTETLGDKLSAERVVDDIIEHLTEDFEDPESVEVAGREEFEAAVKTFIGIQSYPVWHPAKRKVAVPPVSSGGAR